MSDTNESRGSGDTSNEPQGDPWLPARSAMVQKQLQERGIRDHRVLKAMFDVPRHAFVMPGMQLHAYEDRPLDIGWGQTISQPYMVGLMTELLRLTPEAKVLDIGTGSGYQAAVLSLLASRVITVERHERLAATAAFRLESLGYSNVTVVVGDGSLGYPLEAPYDAILVAAGAPRVSETLKRQLATGGRLVCPVGPMEAQMLLRVTRTPEGFTEERSIDCRFVPLIGDEGWHLEGEGR